jgi:hypothetical protein
MISKWKRNIKKKFDNLRPSHSTPQQAVHSPPGLPNHATPFVSSRQSSIHDTEIPLVTTTPAVTTPNRASITEACASSLHETPSQPVATPSLWSRAYEDLRSNDNELVTRYEKLLSKQIPSYGMFRCPLCLTPS